MAASNSPSGADSPIDGDNFIRAHAAFIRQLYDGTGSAAAALADIASTSDAAKGAGLVGFARSLTYAAGSVGAWAKAPIVNNVVDAATIGTTDTVTNPTFTGSPATGWTIANFTSNNPGATHTAGTVGSLARNVTLTAFAQYQLSITLSTTTAGGVAVFVDGVDILDTGVYHGLPVQGSTTYTFPWIVSTSGSKSIEFRTDTAWAGQITAMHFYAVQTTLAMGYTVQATDDPTLTIPQGVRFGRFNAGVVSIGDSNTGALGSTNAVWNVSIGARAAWGNVDGIENTAVGAFALQSNLASQMTAYGYSALKNNSTGVKNTALGFKALGLNSTGSRNDAYGYHAMLQHTTGTDNLAAGYQALYNLLTTSGNTSVGAQSALNCRGTENTYLGALAGQLNASSSTTYTYSYGVMVGAETKVYGENGTAVGFAAAVGVEGSPVNNATAIGSNALTKIANTAKVGNGLTDVCLSGRIHYKQLLASNATAAGVTYTVTEFVQSALLSRSGPGSGFSDTTPTAAAIVAAIPGCEVGSGFDLYIRNTSGFTLTMLAGAGITLAGTTSVPTVQTRLYKIQVTDIGSGTEAATVVGIFAAAN